MKEKIPTSELAVSIIFILLLIFFLNPFHILMPDPMLTLMIVVLLVLFGIFASFVFQENVHDERESLHRFIAARFAYLIGTGVLVIGIIIQSLSHNVDIFLVITLILMVLAKVAGFIYAKNRY
ncbi:MAG TPA: hypothetical protein VHE53_05260 [Patescibacteria group bacterium]|nr:hypothetical protein [Patescibacteria group bacterium]